jgi:hypothetical protein
MNVFIVIFSFLLAYNFRHGQTTGSFLQWWSLGPLFAVALSRTLSSLEHSLFSCFKMVHQVPFFKRTSNFIQQVRLSHDAFKTQCSLARLVSLDWPVAWVLATATIAVANCCFSPLEYKIGLLTTRTLDLTWLDLVCSLKTHFLSTQGVFRKVHVTNGRQHTKKIAHLCGQQQQRLAECCSGHLVGVLRTETRCFLQL